MLYLILVSDFARLQEVEGIIMTPYERNLDFWRQLWRVIERRWVNLWLVATALACHWTKVGQLVASSDSSAHHWMNISHLVACDDSSGAWLNEGRSTCNFLCQPCHVISRHKDDFLTSDNDWNVFKMGLVKTVKTNIFILKTNILT